jgi:tetratricopeptide (TPR) repeat protein
MLFDQRRFAEAEAICREQLDSMDRVLGPGHKATVEARTILTEAALRRDDLVEAERLGRLNLEHAIVGVGPGDPAAQAAAVPLVKSLHASGRGTEAEAILRDLIARAEAIAWRRIPDLRTAWKTLAGLVEAEGRYDQATELRSQILAGCEREFGATDPQTIRAAVQLDTCVAAGGTANGDLAAAAKAARHGLDLATSELGVADPLAQTTAVALARILSQSGREEEAATLLRDYLAEVARANPAADAAATPVDATTIQKALAAILEQSGRAAEAIPLRRSILRQYLKTRGPDDNATQQAAQVLQQLLARQAAERPAPEQPAATAPE